MQPYFRDAVGGDVEAIAEILRTDAPPPAATWRRTDLAFRRALDEIERTPNQFLLVGEYDSQLGAIAHLAVQPSLHGGGGRVAELAGLWVAPAFHGTGLATMLIDHAAARAADLGCRRLRAIVTDDRAFWERAGFVHTGGGYERGLVAPRSATAGVA